MIKVDIVNEVSKIADITKVKAEVAVDAVFDAMRLSMQRGERIELRGFGVFQVKPRKRGIGRNPRTGKEVRIPRAGPSVLNPVKTCRTSVKRLYPNFRTPQEISGPHVASLGAAGGDVRLDDARRGRSLSGLSL